MKNDTPLQDIRVEEAQQLLSGPYYAKGNESFYRAK